jgi:hypothetical protein
MEDLFSPNVRRAPAARMGRYNPPSIIAAAAQRSAKGPGLPTPDARLTKDAASFGWGWHARAFDTGSSGTHPARTSTPARNLLVSNRKRTVKGQDERPGWRPTAGSPLKTAGGQMSKSWSAPQHGKRWLEKKREKDLAQKVHKQGARKLNALKRKVQQDKDESLQHLEKFQQRMDNMESEIEYIDTHYSAKEIKDNIKARGVGESTDQLKSSAMSTFSPPKYRGDTSKMNLCSMLASNNFSKGKSYALDRPSTRDDQRRQTHAQSENDVATRNYLNASYVATIDKFCLDDAQHTGQ